MEKEFYSLFCLFMIQRPIELCNHLEMNFSL